MSVAVVALILALQSSNSSQTVFFPEAPRASVAIDVVARPEGPTVEPVGSLAIGEPVWPTAPGIQTQAPGTASKPSPQQTRVRPRPEPAPAKPAGSEAAPTPRARENSDGATRSLSTSGLLTEPVAREPRKALDLKSPEMSMTSTPAPLDAIPLEPLQETPEGAEAAAMAPASGDAPTEEAPTRFESRSADLAKPLEVVPSVPDPRANASSAAPVAERATGGAVFSVGYWYKILAGALFLASLGLIGYRHKQRARVPYSWRENSDNIAASWLPPRSMPARRAALPRAPEPQPWPLMQKAIEPGARVGKSSPQKAPVAAGNDNTPLVKEVRSQRAGSKRGAQTSSRESRPPRAPEPETDVPFHDEIERRVRKHSTNPAASTENRPAGMRVALSEQDYGRILDLSRSGIPNKDIAREIGISLAAVGAILKVRKGGVTAARLPPSQNPERGIAH